MGSKVLIWILKWYQNSKLASPALYLTFVNRYKKCWYSGAALAIVTHLNKSPRLADLLQSLLPTAFTIAHSISDVQPQVVLVFFRLHNIYWMCSNILSTVIATVEKNGEQERHSVSPSNVRPSSGDTQVNK